MAALLAKQRLPFAAKAVRPAAPKAVRMVCRAQAQAPKPSIAQLAAPAVTLAVSNLLMAMPAEAAGKLFVSASGAL